LPLAGRSVRSNSDSLATVPRAERQTRLPTLHATAARDSPMKSLSPWQKIRRSAHQRLPSQPEYGNLTPREQLWTGTQQMRIGCKTGGTQRLQSKLAQGPKKYWCRWVLHLMLILKEQKQESCRYTQFLFVAKRGICLCEFCARSSAG
jgi:hypothetical protein